MKYYCDPEGAKPVTNEDIAKFLTHRHPDDEYVQFIYELIARIKEDDEPEIPNGSVQAIGDEVV